MNTILYLVCFILMFALNVGTCRAQQFAIFPTVAPGAGNGKYSFKNLKFQKYISGEYIAVELLPLKYIVGADFSSREVGGAPISVISFEFSKDAIKFLDGVDSKFKNGDGVIFINDSSRTLISIPHLINIISKGERLFIGFPLETSKEADLLEKAAKN